MPAGKPPAKPLKDPFAPLKMEKTAVDSKITSILDQANSLVTYVVENYTGPYTESTSKLIVKLNADARNLETIPIVDAYNFMNGARALFDGLKTAFTAYQKGQTAEVLHEVRLLDSLTSIGISDQSKYNATAIQHYNDFRAKEAIFHHTVQSAVYSQSIPKDFDKQVISLEKSLATFSNDAVALLNDPKSLNALSSQYSTVIADAAALGITYPTA